MSAQPQALAGDLKDRRYVRESIPVNLRIASRVALVTGGSRGIGRAIALDLAREGARVAFTYSSSASLAAGVEREIHDMGAEAMAVPLDLGSDESICGAVGRVLNRWGSVDILVNNAVRRPASLPAQALPFEKVPAPEWRSVLRDNLEGPYLLIQEVLASMKSRRWGRIVNISSGIVADGLPGAGPHVTAKGGLQGLTPTLARELAPEGILVNVLMPSLTLTDGTLDKLTADFRECRAHRTTLGRLATPEEVGAVVAFLCSGANTTITGEVIRLGR